MPHARYSSEDISRLGEELYVNRLRSEVETEANIGKIISIDIETGNYAIDDDPVVTGRLLLKEHPDAAIYGRRIGYDAVYAIGGTLLRTTGH